MTRNVPSCRVAVIGGGGLVGAATVNALVLTRTSAEILVVDADDLAAEGQALDIADASPGSGAIVRHGTFLEAAKSDIIIVSANYLQKPGETRATLLGKNKDIVISAFTSMGALNPTAKVLVVADPVDVLTHLAHKASGLPRSQVFGYGTHLDSQRLRNELAARLDVDPTSIHAYSLGEHGDRQFVPWSIATVGGTPLMEHPAMEGVDLDEIRKIVTMKAYKIIAAKGSTYFGVGASVAEITKDVLANRKTVFPLVHFCEDYGIYMSWPCSIGSNGVEQTFNPILSPEETCKLQEAVAAIKAMCVEADAV